MMGTQAVSRGAYSIKTVAFALLIRMFYLCINYILNDLQYVYRIILYSAL